MSIQPGDRIPDAIVHELGTGPQPVATATFFAARQVVLFAVPGAFTPTCSSRHLPGYAARLADFAERGITVACLAVNDAWVMAAWAAAQHVPSGLVMLADGNADFTTALGLAQDDRAFGMGVRAQRFALLADDGIVTDVQIEAPGELRVSTAEAMLARIDAARTR